MISSCNRCRIVYNVTGEASFEEAICLTCGDILVSTEFLEAFSRAYDSTLPDAGLTVLHMTADDYWKQAVARGVASERPHPKLMLSMMLAHSVKDVKFREVGCPKRMIVDSILLGEKRFHFATSVQGATIYRVTNG